MRIETVSDEDFVDLVHAAGRTVPVEQAPVWDAFDAVVEGRSFWRRLVALEGDKPVAVISLTHYTGRGFAYLWAKHGPVWLTAVTADAERTFALALRDYVAQHAPGMTFVRLHAHHQGNHLHDLLQTVTYDETVVVDLTPTEEQIMMSMGKTGRKKLRRTLSDPDFALSEERHISREGFAELYDIYRETAQRDGFGIYPAQVYYDMLAALGDSARLFVARRTDGPGAPGRAVSWVLSTVYDGVGQDYYGGSNLEGFETNAALRLKWHILMSVKADGGHTYDMMGVGSARSPQLMGVRQFKLQFAPETTPVDPSWDLPVKRMRYRALTWALALKHALNGLRRKAKRS